MTEQQQIKKGCSYATCNNIDGLTDYDTKQNKSEKDSVTQRRDLRLPVGRVSRGEKEREFGISRCN